MHTGTSKKYMGYPIQHTGTHTVLNILNILRGSMIQIVQRFCELLKNVKQRNCECVRNIPCLHVHVPS